MTDIDDYLFDDLFADDEWIREYEMTERVADEGAEIDWEDCYESS